MADVVGLTLVKRMPYRGNALEEYSNTYHFAGGIPADSAEWKTLTDALIVAEKTLYPAEVTVVRAYGYSSDAEDAVAVWSWDYAALATTVAGTLTIGGGVVQAGDASVWVRWRTNHLNTKGRPVYLRKYFHPAVAVGSASGQRDQVSANQITALGNFGTSLQTGAWLTGRYIRARAYFPQIDSVAASAFITTRTLKRRGKRPGS